MPVHTHLRKLGARVGIPAIALAVVVGTSTAASASATKRPPTARTSCVTDPNKVIRRRPTFAMTHHRLSSRLVAKLDAAAKSSFAQAATPGIAVGVRTRKGTWTKAYGDADPATGAPMTDDMHTRIGSVTKTFTGTVLLQLAAQRKLSLDDPIAKYVDGVPNGDRITLRVLANMTSGIESYTRSTAFTDQFFAHPETVFTPDQLIAVGLAGSPIFEPGARFDYSNTNTVLLGQVIEKVTRRPIASVFDDMVFDRLHLDQTSWPGTSTAIPAPFPQGFTLQGSGTPSHPANATHWNPSWGNTAGELISNLDDLLTYGRALGTGQGLLDPATQRERLTSFPGAAGYGLALGCVDGWVGHSGELPGYNTSVFYDTTTDTTVIVQANSDIASGNCPESPTLTDDPRELPCAAPATRVFVALSTALGHTFTPPPLA